MHIETFLRFGIITVSNLLIVLTKNLECFAINFSGRANQNYMVHGRYILIRRKWCYLIDTLHSTYMRELSE